jgi:putative endonuclease
MGEEEAVRFLQKKGVEILERNFRGRDGEIDIIAREEGVLLFIEVKYRTSGRCGEPEEAVTPAKQHNICRTALYYLHSTGRGTQDPMRFDVISVTGAGIRWIRDAFPFIR